MDTYIITKEEIEQYDGIEKTHFLNQNAQRTNKSLGDLTGLQQIGFHIVEIEPGKESTEFHRHYHEEECVYVLEGSAESIIGSQVTTVKAGDFIGYRAGGEAHKLHNRSDSLFRCIVVGQRLPHDVADYPNQNKRIFRQQGLKWNLVDIDDITEPSAGRKA